MLLTALLSAALVADTIRFPTVTSDNLEGKTFTLPQDFGGERNILFIAFQRQQQAEVDTWVPFVKPLVLRTPETEYYEIPTIKRMIAPMRWMINSGMRGGIDDRGARERTITLYLDKTPFKRALGISDGAFTCSSSIAKDGCYGARRARSARRRARRWQRR